MATSINSSKDRPPKRKVTFSIAGFISIIILNLVLIIFLGWQAGLLARFLPATPSTLSPAISPTLATSAPTITATLPALVTPTPPPDSQSVPTYPEVEPGTLPGMMVLSLSEAGYFHLFAYHPEILPLTRLTFGTWDDIQPAISPDGRSVAFSSHRNGQWDIYLLDLVSGTMQQMTNDTAYDGNPAFSSDGIWLAYEKYVDNSLDIYIQGANFGAVPVRVTTNPAQDFEPVWRPDSSQIAFTSTRTGKKDIWLVDTNLIGSENAEINYTNNKTIHQEHPSWSPGGDQLAWIAPYDGYESIYIAQIDEPASKAQRFGSGTKALWSPDGKYMLTLQTTPYETFYAISNWQDQTFALLPNSLPGSLSGIAWGNNALPAALSATFVVSSRATPQAPWVGRLTPDAGDLYGRQYTIDLPDVKAPHAALNALAIEPFYALKDRVSTELSWDVLSDLENAFVDLTQSLPPGRANDWLYTGRAFALNSVLVDLDYMLIVREDYGTQTYWRIYLKPLHQDGSQGRPLTDFPWDFNARISGNTSAYEQGGIESDQIPSGYWVDFTALANEYGWDRQPALSNWRSYYPAARFNLFAITSGLTWEDAMLQLWPAEIFLTPPSP